MKIVLNLTDEQKEFLRNHPDFHLQDWFNHALNKKIIEMEVRDEKKNVIIAAAGYHLHMPTRDTETPIAMLKIKGKSLLERQIEVIKKFNIDDITVIRGYKKEHFDIPGIHYIDNNEYDSTGILYSFFLATEKIIGKTILLYGDILFERDIVERLLSISDDFAVVVDRSWRDRYQNRVQHTLSEAELVEVTGDSISRMGHGIPYDSVYGEFIGMATLSKEGAEKAKTTYEELKQTPDKKDLNGHDLSKASLVDFFNALIKKGERIAPVDVFGGWFEIDTFEDYRKSWTFVR